MESESREGARVQSDGMDEITRERGGLATDLFEQLGFEVALVHVKLPETHLDKNLHDRLDLPGVNDLALTVLRGA